MKCFLYILCILCISLFMASASAFNLSVSVSGEDSTADGVAYTHLGQTLTFSCTPTGHDTGVTYLWEFDDLETYTNAAVTAQNPTHVFNWPGRHEVWVTVTETGGSQTNEKALIIVDVGFSATRNERDVTSSNTSTGCGIYALSGGQLDGSSDAGADIADCINTYHDATNGVTLQFPGGNTYRFNDISWNAGARYIGVEIADGEKISFIGIGTGQPIIKYFNDAGSSNSWDTLVLLNGTSWFHARNIDFQNDPSSLGGALTDATVQQLTAGLNLSTRKMVIEDSTISDFGRVTDGDGRDYIQRRTSWSKWGVCNVSYGTSGRISWMKGAHATLSIRNYVAAGYSGSSHPVYASGPTDVHWIKNYIDGTEVHPDKTIIQMKNAVTNCSAQGNLLVGDEDNINCFAIGANGFTGSGVTITDNRCTGATDANGKGVGVQDHDNVLVSGNLFMRVGSTVANFTCIDIVTEQTNVSYTDNIAGFEAGSDSAGGAENHLVETNSGCDPNVTASGNADNTVKYISTDPAGWWTAAGYNDPGAWEYIAPTNIGSGATDNGSGMESAARFPFQEGALAQGRDGSNNYSQVELYGDRSNLSSWSEIRYADVDHNWSGLETFIPGTVRGITF